MHRSIVVILMGLALVACGDDASQGQTTACGITTCAEGSRCCDHCAGTCIPETSGAFCPDDNEPNRECDAQTCGQDSCDVDLEVCLVTGPIGPSVNSSCEPVPAACQSDRTCDCLYDELCPTGYIACTDSGPNEIYCDNGSQ